MSTTWRGPLEISPTDGVKRNTALLIGAGTSSSYEATSSADKNFAEFRTKSTATSGDSRGLYWRHYLSGANQGGEAARLYSTFEGATATGVTVNGAHVSLSLTASANLTGGLGNALRATLDLGGATYGGNMSAIMAEIVTTTSSVVPATHGLFRAVVSGNATANALVKNLLHVDVASDCVGNLAAKKLVSNAAVTTSSTAGLQVCVQGTQYWIPLHAIA